MDPFTALGLAAAIIQFIEFGAKVISTSREIYVSSSGLSSEHETLEDVCSHMELLVDVLDEAADDADAAQRRINEEVALRRLSDKCKRTAVELQNLLKSLYGTPGGKISSLCQALRASCGKSKVDGLEAKLKEYRQELITHLVAITSNQQSTVLRELRKLKEVNLSMRLSHSDKLDEISRTIQQLTFQSSRTKESPSQDGAFSRQDFQHLSDRLLDLTESARNVSFQQRVLRGLYFKMMLVRRHSIAEAHARTFSWIFKHQNESELADADHVNNFANWLENGKGIYWISGKAGSGKSILFRILDEAFFYAREAELESGRAEVELVSELRHTIEEMADSHGFEPPWELTYFLEFAIRKGLAQYLSEHRKCLANAKKVANGSYLQEALTESIDLKGDDEPDLTEVIALFLDRGTDPNLAVFSHQAVRDIQCPNSWDSSAGWWKAPNKKDAYADDKPLMGTIWGDWIIMLSAAIAGSGLHYTWAQDHPAAPTRPERPLSHFHGLQVVFRLRTSTSPDFPSEQCRADEIEVRRDRNAQVIARELEVSGSNRRTFVQARCQSNVYFRSH